MGRRPPQGTGNPGDRDQRGGWQSSFLEQGNRQGNTVLSLQHALWVGMVTIIHVNTDPYLIDKKKTRGARVIAQSISQALLLQAWGPEFDPLGSTSFLRRTWGHTFTISVLTR